MTMPSNQPDHVPTAVNIDPIPGVPDLACPVCGRSVDQITRGRLREDGPFTPTTYWPCGCQPMARFIQPTEEN